MSPWVEFTLWIHAESEHGFLISPDGDEADAKWVSRDHVDIRGGFSGSDNYDLEMVEHVAISKGFA